MNVLETDRLLAQHPWHALFFAVFALYLYGTVVFIAGGALFPDLSAQLDANDPAGLDTAWLLQAVLFFCIFVHMTLWAERIGAGPFSAPIKTSPNWAVVAVVSGPIVYSVLLWISFYIIAGGEEGWAYSDKDFEALVDGAEVTAAMIIAVGLIGPIFEEVAYRGIAMGALLGRGLPTAVAVVLPAFLFAMSHTQYTLAALFAVFMFGIFLAVLRIKSQSIAPPILAHMSVNLFLTIGVG